MTCPFEKNQTKEFSFVCGDQSLFCPCTDAQVFLLETELLKIPLSF